MKEHEFVQSLSNPSLLGRVKRDIRLLVLEIRWTVRGEVPFGWQHLDGNFVLEPCDPMGPRIWQPSWRLT